MFCKYNFSFYLKKSMFFTNKIFESWSTTVVGFFKEVPILGVLGWKGSIYDLKKKMENLWH